MAPFILLYVYAKCYYSPREWLYIEWRTSHTCGCIPCRYMSKAEHDSLWLRVKCTHSTPNVVKNVTEHHHTPICARAA